MSIINLTNKLVVAICVFLTSNSNEYTSIFIGTLETQKY